MMGYDLYPNCDCSHLHRVHMYGNDFTRTYKCMSCGQSYTITRGSGGVA